MFKNFNLNIANLFRCAEEERKNLNHPYVGTEHLLLAILKREKEYIEFFKTYNLTYETFRNELIMIVGNCNKNLQINLYTPMLKRVINNAIENAKEDNKGNITVRHLLISLLEEGEGIAIRLLIGMGYDIDKIYEDLNQNNKIKKEKSELYETGIILNENVSLNELVVGRDKEIDLIIETLLRKKKNNPILIGEAGVGKTAIVEELARRIEKKEVPESLYNTKIISLEMGNLVSGTKYRGEFEEKLTKIIKELENNSNIILFVDEIHTMVNAGGAEGAIGAGDIFKPALARGKIKCIGATTNYEYNKYFSCDKALMRRFEVINIEEPNDIETKDILLKVKKEYEMHHNVIIKNDIIDKIILYTSKFIHNKKNPDKAIDFLDSVCSKVKTNNSYSKEKRMLYDKLDKLKDEKNLCIKKNNYEKALNIYQEEIKINNAIKNSNKNKKILIKEKDILSVLENKTNFLLTIDKLKILDDLKIKIKEKLFGLDEVIEEIINLMKNNFLNRDGFLKIYLEGERYLGKSTLVKLISENFPKCNFIKINLNEYKSYSDISKLIGTNQGYVGYNDDHIFSKLKNNNFSIILFDNYSSAHENVKKIIKVILEDGYILDNKGEKICFNNSFIFITDDIIKNNKVGFNNECNNLDLNEISNLVDKVITFNKLSKDTLNKYLETLKVNNKEEIIKLSNYEKYNYKNIEKLIKRKNLINN